MTRAELDAQRLTLRGKATAAIGLSLAGIGGFILVGGMASSGTTYEDNGEQGKRMAAGGFAVLMAGSLVAIGGLAAYLAGHRRLDRLRRAGLGFVPTRGGAMLGLHGRF